METNEQLKQLWREQKQLYRQNRKEYCLIFSKAEDAQLKEFAKVKKMRVPVFIKSLIKTYGKNSDYILPDDNTLQSLILEIRKIGTNINQTTKYVNTNKTISQTEFKALRSKLIELESLIISKLQNPDKKVS